MREVSELGTLGFLSLEVLSFLRLRIVNEPLLPNLKDLCLWKVHGQFVPFIPLFLSPRTTSIDLRFLPGPPTATIASMVETLHTLCPNLQLIYLLSLPSDPMITSAVSEMALATTQNLQYFKVDSPLAEEASEAIYKLPNLRSLRVVIERETPLPSASLPNLNSLMITCDDGSGWPRLFHGATFGKLQSITLYPESEEIGNFLGTFERAALSSSVQNTLLEFHISAPLWNPNYSSLLSFTQLVDLNIEFSCVGGCLSRVDDGIIIDLSRAMPKLQGLRLGCDPCREFTIGATAKGLMALALHCPNLSHLCIHFQVASLSALPASPEMTPSAKPTTSWTDCALAELTVGEIPVPEEPALMVTLALLHIFPRIERIVSVDDEWMEVEDAICLSKQLADYSSKRRPLTTR